MTAHMSYEVVNFFLTRGLSPVYPWLFWPRVVFMIMRANERAGARAGAASLLRLISPAVSE